MVSLLHFARECFFLLRRHCNDAIFLLFRHREGEQPAPNLFRGLSNLNRPAITYFIVASIFILSTTISFSQTSQETIKIGFLIRDKSDLVTKQAAQLAIEHANANGGYHGKPFELITKSCDGPWGVGSKQAVDLVYEDEVSLIVGALDGRNAHLAEQVAAKSHVVMLSTQSSDPTLSRAYVPWYFRILPDDKQQAEVLVEEIYYKEKYTKVALVSLDAYDGKMSVESMVKKSEEKGLPNPKVYIEMQEHELFVESFKNPWDAIVLSGTSKNVSEFISKIKSANRNTKIYAFLNLFNSMDGSQYQLMENICFVSSFGMKSPAWLSFEKAWKVKYGYKPSPTLAFVYDGIMLSIEAIRKFGTEQEDIKNNFKTMKFEGITGEIKFDGLGNREMKFFLVKILEHY